MPVIPQRLKERRGRKKRKKEKRLKRKELFAARNELIYLNLQFWIRVSV